MRNLAGISKKRIRFFLRTGWARKKLQFIKNVFREKRWNFWLISGCFVRYLTSLWVVWLVCRWFVDGLDGLWVALLVCGWFRVLQLTFNFYTES